MSPEHGHFGASQNLLGETLNVHVYSSLLHYCLYLQRLPSPVQEVHIVQWTSKEVHLVMHSHFCLWNILTLVYQFLLYLQHLLSPTFLSHPKIHQRASVRGIASYRRRQVMTNMIDLNKLLWLRIGEPKACVCMYIYYHSMEAIYITSNICITTVAGS